MKVQVGLFHSRNIFSFLALFDQDLAAALRAGNPDFLGDGLGIAAFGEAGACQELPESPHFVNHQPSAFLTGDIAHLIGNLNMQISNLSSQIQFS
jgi:hypothetical protein